MSEVSNFSYGDNVVFTKDSSGAPKGTKAQFLQAVGHGGALVKITKRIPPSKDRSGEPHYVNGAKTTTRLDYLAKDDGTPLPKDDSSSDVPIWKPAYEPK